MRLLLYLSLLLRTASAHACTLSAQGCADCTQRGLNHVPSTLPRNLQYLDLSANSIHHLQRFPAKFSQLLHLNLSGNPIHLIPAGTFRDLSHLQDLDLSSCKISRLHSNAFEGLLHLRTLILRDNPLQDINLQNITALTRLDVRGTTLMALPRMRVLMEQLAGQGLCDCSSRIPLYESHARVSGNFCSCVTLTERRDRDVWTAKKADSEVMKRYIRDILPISNDSLPSNLTTPSVATPVSQGRSWPYLVGFVLIAATVSLLIAAAVKCNLFHRYFRSYRHRPLPDSEWITESQNELPGVPLPPQEDEDGFIEDNYIGDRREEPDDDEIQMPPEDLSSMVTMDTFKGDPNPNI